MHLNSTYVLNFLVIYHPKDYIRSEEIRKVIKSLHKENKNYVLNSISFGELDLDEFAREMLKDLIAAADLILVLMSEESIISPLFISGEMRQAVEMTDNSERMVVPIMLQTCWWEDTFYKNLTVLPRAGLPLYDNPAMQELMFNELLEELQKKVETVKQRKLDTEDTYKTILAEADKLFESWETKPELLRKCLPLYKESLDHWREGFLPPRMMLEARIELCSREMNFYHYSEAAKAAYKQGDTETAYFNCKDALEMREDAVIRKIFEELDKKNNQENDKILKEPFERHLKKAQEHFLAMRWEEAKEEYTHSLEFHEPHFNPPAAELHRKIAICIRENELETTLRKVKVLNMVQNYSLAVETLAEALKHINHEAYGQLEQLLTMIRNIENAIPYYDNPSQKWGYYHEKTQDIIIAPKYNAAYSFSENLAGVKKWEKWGFIDIEGNEVIPFIYDFVGHFRNGVAEVSQKREMFYINHRGERVPEPEVKKLG